MIKTIYFKVSINIFLVFLTAMLVSFIPDMMHDFFGDWKCEGSGEYIQSTWRYAKCNYGEHGSHDPYWHWGYRHWLWCFMGICLFVVQAIRIGVIIDKHNNNG